MRSLYRCTLFSYSYFSLIYPLICSELVQGSVSACIYTQSTHLFRRANTSPRHRGFGVATTRSGRVRRNADDFPPPVRDPSHRFAGGRLPGELPAGPGTRLAVRPGVRRVRLRVPAAPSQRHHPARCDRIPAATGGTDARVHRSRRPAQPATADAARCETRPGPGVCPAP